LSNKKFGEGKRHNAYLMSHVVQFAAHMPMQDANKMENIT